MLGSYLSLRLMDCLLHSISWSNLLHILWSSLLSFVTHHTHPSLANNYRVYLGLAFIGRGQTDPED